VPTAFEWSEPAPGPWRPSPVRGRRDLSLYAGRRPALELATARARSVLALTFRARLRPPPCREMGRWWWSGAKRRRGRGVKRRDAYGPIERDRELGPTAASGNIGTRWRARWMKLSSDDRVPRLTHGPPRLGERGLVYATPDFLGRILLLTHLAEFFTLSPEAVSRCPVVVRGAETRRSRRPHGVRSLTRKHGVQR